MNARHRPQPVEIETLEDFDKYAAPGTKLAGWEIRGVDLTSREEALRQLRPAGALFLGCRLTRSTADWLRARGALIFPKVPDLPFNPYRTHLYTGQELYTDLFTSYDATPDARIYAWWRADGRGLVKTLAESLHDHSIDDALDDWIDARRVVGIMGGHTTKRGSESYAQAASLGKFLAQQGITVATGGGPGSMEAANMGARFATMDQTAFDSCLELLARAPDYRDVQAWARLGLSLLDPHPDSGLSLGIPTWFYGHEPPNPFSSRIAKYFRNALREDILLSICNTGVVFLPGAAGTVQEIFQAACKVYYAEPGSTFPLVLVGHEYWAEFLPSWGLLRNLGQDHQLGEHIFLVDDVDAAGQLLLDQASD
jgi:predicted Rossmann-fold nucleotide-binding protein